MKTTTSLLLILITCSHLGFSQVTAQWRGPERNGIYPANGIMNNWPETGPVMQWSLAGLGMGNSSAVCDGKRVYVTGLKDNYEFLSAIDTQGKLLWQTLIGKGWDGSYPESRCTPVADEESVYVTGPIQPLLTIYFT